LFERRLKIFLGILLSVMSVLLLRAVHLQVFTRSTWTKAAEDFQKRPVYVETTRGRILDHKNIEIAVDEACMDACVDYRAISRNEKWIADLAARRLKDRLGDQYVKAAKARREAMVVEESAAVNQDIDRMFRLLSDVCGRPLEEIEETCRTINLKIAMRSRYVPYKRFQHADKEHEGSGPPPWYRRWLVEGGDGGPSVDDFEQQSGEEVDAHPVVRNISQAVYTRLAKEAPRAPGLVLRQGTTRRYPFGRAGAHVLGMLSPVNRDDLHAQAHLLDDELRKYDFTDLIGRGGIEALAEPTLRGARGKVYRQIGPNGPIDEVVSDPVPGGDVKTTIDIELQGELQQMFARMKVPSNKQNDPRTFEVPMHGAAVVIDVKTGHVRALASYPDYDPNELATNYEAVADRTDDAPLLNRATQSQLEPGSTIKPVVGISAITQGINLNGAGPMHAHSGIECTGYLVLNGRKITAGGRCWVATRYANLLPSVAHHPIPIPHKGAHGNPDGFLTLADALERSCNVYFETLADKFGVVGLSWWFDRFGLGHETGLGIPEARGLLPERCKTNHASVAWFSGMGQGSILATPVQMANVAATIARDGVWVRPRLVEGDDLKLAPVKPKEDRVIPDRIDLKLSKEALAAAREGMIRVVNSEAGTGGQARMSEVLVAGKTGTAQATGILDPARDDQGNKIYTDADGKLVQADADGYILRTDADGTVVRIDQEGNSIRPDPDGKFAGGVKGNMVMGERPRASADLTTPWPWYRGWGEEGKQVNHAWFIGFAPADDPQVAFAVMIEYGGSGNFAGKVATQVLGKCIEHGYVKVKR
jgi:cell division protein FtsI/penicillin-binding protein 2